MLEVMANAFGVSIVRIKSLEQITNERRKQRENKTQGNQFKDHPHKRRTQEKMNGSNGKY